MAARNDAELQVEGNVRIINNRSRLDAQGASEEELCVPLHRSLHILLRLLFLWLVHKHHMLRHHHLHSQMYNLSKSKSLRNRDFIYFRNFGKWVYYVQVM